MELLSVVWSVLKNTVPWLFSGAGIILISYFIKRGKARATEENSKQVNTPVLTHEKQPLHKDEEAEAPQDSVEILADKFFQLYADHGISRTQIPAVIDKKFGLTLNDVRNAQTLIPKLNHELLHWTAETFGVRESWFDGTGCVQLYDETDLYKNPEALMDMLGGLIDQYGIYEYKKFVKVYLLKNFTNFDAEEIKPDSAIFIIIAQSIGKTSTSRVEKYTLIRPNLLWDYWKSRRDTKKIIRILTKLRVPIAGYDMTEEEFKKLESLTTVPHDILQGKRTVSWYPDDFDGTINEHISTLENEDNHRFQKEFLAIDQFVERLLEEKRNL